MMEAKNTNLVLQIEKGKCCSVLTNLVKKSMVFPALSSFSSRSDLEYRLYDRDEEDEFDLGAAKIVYKRFGTGAGFQGSDALKKSEEQKKKARAERFGIAQGIPEDNEAKKKARLARFAPNAKTEPAQEEKKKARAARFSQAKPTLSRADSNKKVEKTVVDHVQAPE